MGGCVGVNCPTDVNCQKYKENSQNESFGCFFLAFFLRFCYNKQEIILGDAIMPLISVKKLDERAILPTYGSEYAAGADLYALADGDVVFQPGETKFIRTGLAMEIPEGYAGLIYARSGLACKRGLAPANKVGVVDSDYRGEVMVALHNHSTVEQKISAGERIAQLVVAPFLKATFTEAEELNETVRGEGGFGSTGRK